MTGHINNDAGHGMVDKRRQILEAGLSIMRTHGYHGTGIQEIVKTAGVPKGSFYNYFDSKQAFAVAALEAAAQESLSALSEALNDRGRSPRARIFHFFLQEAERFRDTNQCRGGCFIGTLRQEMADADETIRLTADRLLAEYDRILAGCLDEACERGELDPLLDTVQLASFITLSWEGALLRSKGSRDARPLEAFCYGLEVVFHNSDSFKKNMAAQQTKKANAYPEREGGERG